MSKKYIFVSGGVCSSLGKGITSSSIAAIMECYGYSISFLKIDPYLNVDAGTMSPLQHGETFVTEDGAETDLDLGNYERFTEYNLSKENSVTTGQIYREVISRERKGEYLGRCVQVIPHVTNEIKKRIYALAKQNVDIVIIEVGGTVGDIEVWSFLEAIRQFINEVGKGNSAIIHLTLLPNLSTGDGLKTKPSQHSVQRLREAGLQPDILMCRINKEIPEIVRKKLSMFTSVPEEAVIEAKNLSSIYQAPLDYNNKGLGKMLLKTLEIKNKKEDFSKWYKLNDDINNLKGNVNVGIVGKYTYSEDAYKSIYESLLHASYVNGLKINTIPIDSEKINSNNVKSYLSTLDIIIIPGGFGSRGIEGKILATQYARENNIPFLGICLGMQIMVIEFARNVLNLSKANSSEFDSETPDPVVHMIASQTKISNKGGTMRLGAYKSNIVKGTLLEKIYNNNYLSERHRHRYEINKTYLPQLEKNGLLVSCQTKQLGLVESMEWKEHPFGVGVQFHPEFKSKPFNPHPIFKLLIEAGSKK